MLDIYSWPGFVFLSFEKQPGGDGDKNHPALLNFTRGTLFSFSPFPVFFWFVVVREENGKGVKVKGVGGIPWSIQAGRQAGRQQASITCYYHHHHHHHHYYYKKEKRERRRRKKKRGGGGGVGERNRGGYQIATEEMWAAPPPLLLKIPFTPV